MSVNVQKIKSKWSRAVWREGTKVHEEVVLSKWIDELRQKVFWPVKINASRAEKEEMDPGPHWKVFELIKVKVCHDDVEVCKGYDLTSASDQDMEQIKKEQIFKCITEKKGLPPIPEKISEFNEMDDCDFNRFQSSVDLIKSIKIPKKNYEDVSRCHDSTRRSRSRSPIHRSRYNSAAHNSRSPSKSPTLHNSRSSYRQYNTKDNSQSKKANWKRSPHRYQTSRSISSSSESPTKSSSKQSSNVTNRLEESFNEKGNFTDASQNISYPIETGKFQKGVMKFMAEVKIFMNDMNTFMGKQINNRGESNREELKQLLDIDEFLQFEENLVEPVFRTKIIEHLKQVGGVDGKDAIRRIIDRVFSVQLQSKLNMKGTGHKLGIEDKLIWKVIKESVFAIFPQVREAEIRERASVKLKNAPGRKSGDRRKIQNTGK